MTYPDHSLSSCLCWDSFTCPYCLIPVQPQPQSGVRHENGQGSSCFGCGELTEDAKNKQEDRKYIEGGLSNGANLLRSNEATAEGALGDPSQGCTEDSTGFKGERVGCRKANEETTQNREKESRATY